MKILVLMLMVAALIQGGCSGKNVATETTPAVETETSKEIASAEETKTAEETTTAGKPEEYAVEDVTADAYSDEVRGVWISFWDFDKFGLKDAGEEDYRKNLGNMMKLIKYYGFNTVIWHARAFDDATWKSDTFKACSYMSSSSSPDKTAAETYDYDPLGIACELAKENGLSFHAWFNPYRIGFDTYYAPETPGMTDRILRAIDELKAYDIDGIHFDDYFYSSSDKYVTLNENAIYDIFPETQVIYTSEEVPEVSTMTGVVNEMLLSVYNHIKEVDGWQFGISPSGNIEYALSIGADVKYWLSDSTPKMMDYIVPQIYWTNKYGKEEEKVTLFTNRLNEFIEANKCGMPMYIGLYSDMAGVYATSDQGWIMSDTNLADMVKEIRSDNLPGFVLFSVRTLYLGSARPEIDNLRDYLGR